VPGFTSTGPTSLGSTGLSRGIDPGSANSPGAFFTLEGTTTAREGRFEDFAGAFDPIPAIADGTNGGLAHRADIAHGADLGRWGTDIELYGPGAVADTWNLLVVKNQSSSANRNFNRIRKVVFDPLTGHGASTVGSRTASGNTGGIIATAVSEADLLVNLVPGVNDFLRGVGYDAVNNYLYVVSDDGNSGNVYLSAITFEWAPGGDFANDSVATFVDLDPDSANNYLEISFSGIGGSLVGSISVDNTLDVAVSPDATELYVSNNGSRIFIFDNTTPEPATMMLVALGGVPLLLRLRRRRSRRT
jgi:hypothetical protein